MTEESYTDSADVSQLETRIDELEATIRKMLPSRREALGMGVAGLAGASLMSGTASAGSSQVGTIGDNSNLVDLVAEDVTITDTINTASISGAAADEALLSDGTGDLKFGSVTAVEEVSTFGNLPAIDPPQLAYVTDEEEYYYSRPIGGTPFDVSSTALTLEKTLSTQNGNPTGLEFNDDGTKLYETGEFLDEIHEHELSIPFDIGSATLVTSITAQGDDPQGIQFSNDGLKMFEVDSTTDSIFEFVLSSAFDISTASAGTSIAVQDPTPRGIAFNDDGTKLYEAGSNQDKIFESVLSSPFDITTASFNTSINSQGAGISGLEFNNDGTRLFEVDEFSDTIFQLELSTPFDIATATLQTSANTQDSNPRGVKFSNDGSKLFEIGAGSDNIYQVSLSTGGWEEF